MLGLLVIIVASWVLLHFIEKKNIDVLGIVPNKKRAIQFLIGIVVISIVFLLNVYIETIVWSVKWEINSVIDYKSILNTLIYHLKSALTEDLIFRGAILYILIQRLGIQKAAFISAFFFGIYHVFSYGMLGGRIVPIVFVIVTTGVTGYVWAFTFAKTNSMLMGLGFHLGSNMVLACFFTSQPYGELIFTEISRVDLPQWNRLFFSIIKGLLPSVLIFVFLKLWIRFNFKID